MIMGISWFVALVLCVFFSSRRRHTRYWRDWSSDVCSSDLGDRMQLLAGTGRGDDRQRQPLVPRDRRPRVAVHRAAHGALSDVLQVRGLRREAPRSSIREAPMRTTPARPRGGPSEAHESGYEARA